MKDKVAMGKKSKSAGMRFERKVRDDLEAKGWIVDKWTNNVDLDDKECECGCRAYIHKNSGVGTCMSKPEGFFLCKCIRFEPKGRLHPAKSFRGITRSNGFPDFIAIRSWFAIQAGFQEVIAVESKMNGVLSKIEKEKCQWYLDNNIFSKILIARKSLIYGEIIYKEYSERGLKK